MFGQFVRLSRKGFRHKMCTFCFLSFLCWRKKKRKHAKIGKQKVQKTPRKIVFWGWLWTKMVLFWMSFLRKIGKHYLCSEGQKSAHFRCNYLFWENGPFLVPIQSHQTLKNRGFSRHGGKPQMALLVASAILGFPSKRGFTICDTQKLCSAENTIFIVFSAKHSFVDMKECSLKKKQKFYQK